MLFNGYSAVHEYRCTGIITVFGGDVWSVLVETRITGKSILDIQHVNAGD